MIHLGSRGDHVVFIFNFSALYIFLISEKSSFPKIIRSYVSFVLLPHVCILYYQNIVHIFSLATPLFLEKTMVMTEG
jgi:hypothetical protein